MLWDSCSHVILWDVCVDVYQNSRIMFTLSFKYQVYNIPFSPVTMSTTCDVKSWKLTLSPSHNWNIWPSFTAWKIFPAGTKKVMNVLKRNRIFPLKKQVDFLDEPAILFQGCIQSLGWIWMDLVHVNTRQKPWGPMIDKAEFVVPETNFSYSYMVKMWIKILTVLITTVSGNLWN